MPQVSPDIRGFIAPYTEWAAAGLHERFPRLEADHLSFAGAVLTTAGAVIAASPIERPARIAAPLILLGVLTDTFNGVLARECYGDDHERLARGNKVDSASDLVKDLAMEGSSIVAAHRSGSGFRQSVAEFAAITTPLASLSRPYKEQQGYKISEHGDSNLELLGTRAARTALHAVAASNISVRGIPLQTASDALIVIGNLTRIAKNLTKTEKEPKIPAILEKARFRAKFHGASVALTAAGIVGVRKLLK